MATVLKERAENLTLDELRSVTLINNLLDFQLEDYFSNNINCPQFLLGRKGSGKTLNTMKALSKVIHENENFLPVMFVYEQQKKLSLLDPRRLAPPEVWGSRYEKLQTTDKEELMKVATAVVRDDYHYETEDLMRGRGSLEQFTSDLEGLSEQANNGKKVLLISENHLSSYVEKLSKRMNTERLEEVLLKFGQPPYYRVAEDPKKYYETSERANYLAFREVPPISWREWTGLLGVYDVKIEEPIECLIYDSTSQPRAFVKFAKAFQKNEGERVDITVDSMIKKAVETLPQHTLSPQELKQDYYLLNFHKIPFRMETTSLYSSETKYRDVLAEEMAKIRNKTFEMREVYHSFPTVKKMCKEMLASETAKRELTYEDMLSLSKKRYGEASSFLEVKEREKKLSPSTKGKVVKVVADPLMFNFLSTVDFFERRKKDFDKLVTIPKENYPKDFPKEKREYRTLLKRDLDLEIELNKYENSLMSELLNFDRGSDNYNVGTRNYFVPWQSITDWKGERKIEYRDYLFLRRPLQKAFEDQLYEAPSLEVINALLG